MRVIAIKDSYKDRPDRLAVVVQPESYCYVKIGAEYEVYAVCVSRGVVKYQIVLDENDDFPDWYPAWLFTVSDYSVPKDWSINSFGDTVELVLGPAFLIADAASFDAMINLEPSAQENFWTRFKNLKNAKV